VTDDSSPERADAASLAAHYFARARERAAREGAPAELIADVAELADLNARTEALAAEIAADAEPGPDAVGTGIASRYERGARLLDLSAASTEVLARVAGEPEAAELWLVIAGAHREHAAETRKAAALIADAGTE
jgi:hypothetical protein